jgi:hypothetical protein
MSGTELALTLPADSIERVSMHPDLPIARTDGLIWESVDDDSLVYDSEAHVGHALAAAAVRVMKLCDGTRTADDLAREAQVTPELAAQAVSELRERGLVLAAEPGVDVASADRGIDRRRAVRRLAQAGGVAFAAPLIFSVSIAAATGVSSTCITQGDICTQGGEACCAGLVCESRSPNSYCEPTP